MKKTNPREETLRKLCCLCRECWFHPHCFISRGYDKDLAANTPTQITVPAA